MEKVTMKKSEFLHTIILESSNDAPIRIHTKTIDVDDLYDMHYVNKITRGGELLECGLKRGDKLDSINDQSVIALGRKELKKLLKKEISTGQVKLDVARGRLLSTEKAVQSQSDPAKMNLTTGRKSFAANNCFIKEFSVTIEAGEGFGFIMKTYRNGGIYTHQIMEVEKDKPLDRAISFTSVLNKEIVTMNGKYIKNANDPEINQIFSDLRKRGGTVVFGILDDSKIVTNDQKIQNGGEALMNGKSMNMANKNSMGNDVDVQKRVIKRDKVAIPTTQDEISDETLVLLVIAFALFVGLFVGFGVGVFYK